LTGLIVVLVVLKVISINAGPRFNIAIGSFQLSSEQFLFLLQQVIVIVGFLTCLVASIFINRMHFFRVLGKYSLIVYLSHSPIYQTIISISRSMDVDSSGVFWGLISLLLTLLFSVGVSLIIERIALLRNLITPRDYASFKSVFSRS
jgi:peptidoglycan/LPS O-acetylase OafA/YrhL